MRKVKNIYSLVILGILFLSCMTSQKSHINKSQNPFDIIMNIQKKGTGYISNICLGDTIEIITEYLNRRDSISNLSLQNSMLIQDYSGVFVTVDKPDIYLMLDSVPISTLLHPGEKYVSSHSVIVSSDFFYNKENNLRVLTFHNSYRAKSLNIKCIYIEDCKTNYTPSNNYPDIKDYLDLNIQISKDTVVSNEVIELTLLFKNKSDSGIYFYPEDMVLWNGKLTKQQVTI